jgi:transcription elongation factor Elf1
MRENCVNFLGVRSLGKSATLKRPTRGGPAAAASYFAFCACAHSEVSNAFWSSRVANAMICELCGVREELERNEMEAYPWFVGT